jgi:hypothetical protein
MSDVADLNSKRRLSEASAEAVAWGKAQAIESPPWSEDKWRRIAVLVGVEFREGIVDAEAA